MTPFGVVIETARSRIRSHRGDDLADLVAVIDYGFRTLGLQTIRAYTDPGNTPSQKVLLHCGLKYVGEIELTKPTHHGAWCAPLFRISQPAP
jgi:hypothetical protein